MSDLCPLRLLGATDDGRNPATIKPEDSRDVAFVKGSSEPDRGHLQESAALEYAFRHLDCIEVDPTKPRGEGASLPRKPLCRVLGKHRDLFAACHRQSEAIQMNLVPQLTS